MRSVAVSWDPAGGRFVAAGTHDGRLITINAPAGEGQSRRPTGFSATELLLAGAGACAAWDVLEILRKRRHDIIALEVIVDGDQAPDPPWAYERVALHFRVVGRDLGWNVVQRVIRLSCVRYCSVLATLRGVARVEATLELVTADGASTGRREVTLEPALLEPQALAEPPASVADGAGPVDAAPLTPPAGDED